MSSKDFLLPFGSFEGHAEGRGCACNDPLVFLLPFGSFTTAEQLPLAGYAQYPFYSLLGVSWVRVFVAISSTVFTAFLLPFGSFLYTLSFKNLATIISLPFYSLLGVSCTKDDVCNSIIYGLTFYSLLGVSGTQYTMATQCPRT